MTTLASLASKPCNSSVTYLRFLKIKIKNQNGPDGPIGDAPFAETLRDKWLNFGILSVKSSKKNARENL